MDPFQNIVRQLVSNSFYYSESQKKVLTAPSRYFYEFAPGETFMDFHSKLIYTVHPKILEQKAQLDKISASELFDMSAKTF